MKAGRVVGRSLLALLVGACSTREGTLDTGAGETGGASGVGGTGGTGAAGTGATGGAAGIGGTSGSAGMDAGEVCAEGEQRCDGASLETCSGGAWGPGVPCDYVCIDNECAGVCTPGAAQPCGTDLGECVAGEQLCSTIGEWGPCIGEIVPAPADCTSPLDNDCDGTPDQDAAACLCKITDPPQVCDEHPEDGVGTCHAGLRTCVADGASSHWGPCEGSVGPSDEECGPGAQDTNCNGVIGDGNDCTRLVYGLTVESLCPSPATGADALTSTETSEASYASMASVIRVFTTQTAGTVPLARCFGPAHGTFIGNCPSGWTLEYVPGYVSTGPTQGYHQLNFARVTDPSGFYFTYQPGSAKYGFCACGAICVPVSYYSPPI